MGTFTFLQQLSQWKSNEYYAICVCICSLRYLTCKAHAPYYHLLPVSLYKIFEKKKKLLSIKYLFRASLQILPATFFILWGTEREMIKKYIGLRVKYHLFLFDINPLNAELNPICHLMALLGNHHILHVSWLRVKEISNQITVYTTMQF